MVFKNRVMNIQTAGYNGALTVHRFYEKKKVDINNLGS